MLRSPRWEVNYGWDAGRLWSSPNLPHNQGLSLVTAFLTHPYHGVNVPSKCPIKEGGSA